MEDHPIREDWLTVVGVVDDLKQQALAKSPDPAIYQPYLQVSLPFFLRHMTFVVRTTTHQESVASGMLAILKNVGKDQPISITSMDSLIATTIAEPQFQARLLASFALIALALTIVGVYGVLSYSVVRRVGCVWRWALRMWMCCGCASALVLISAGIVIGGAGSLACVCRENSCLSQAGRSSNVCGSGDWCWQFGARPFPPGAPRGTLMALRYE
jgi:hypothetical protein